MDSRLLSMVSFASVDYFVVEQLEVVCWLEKAPVGDEDLAVKKPE
jgi:hypothetical protein